MAREQKSFPILCMETLAIINGFFHDFSTGIWLGALAVMEYVERNAVGNGEAAVQFFAMAMLQRVWRISLLALAIMLVTGVLRVFTLKYYGWSGDIAGHRKRMLFIKHCFLGGLMLVGLFLQWKIFRVMQGI
ncbi:hypothetical protein TherJR_2858 [Thermincola potens JR]|uniref:Uncharacterized protein n=2 Tax=Thermincola TaxID=278993 RepID=D5XD14_THEPJ|nr:hypothetical protein TherJR_2858 [Thermincola potens JR]